ncbi:MAG TPA: alcohol dehydrogenase catalytic domain-containing protein [Sedimentisphaerales bacterium]|nr:alcohol dehydrogenase catalytic domain-containing protein [Sedimentisphaerales bacterium]HRS09545.1 alcohol dehydrogenase catalytic domain-containing protein [Sedimentisphaerales bacterium]HRV46242.1 alcohol dehydrogenase catalytic domain-containing protein [Sedimentisphaerales bacterium]
MKAAVLTGVRRMEVREVPDPKIEKGTDVLLKIGKVGVCGSDVHYFETGRIGSQVVQFPFIVGHECAATVAKVGPDVRSLQVGQEVVVEPAVSCHACPQCKAGRENTCFNLRFLGTPGQGNGCLSQYIVMPEECCLPTYGRISIEQGVLCEPLAIAVYAVKQSRLARGKDVAVLGAGPIGLCCLVSARAAGVGACYMTEKIDERVEIARKAGAAWVGNPLREDVVAAILQRRPLGMDIVYECAGQQETIDQAVDLLKPGGTLLLIGIPREDRISLSIDKIRRKEVTIINVRRQNKCTHEAMDLIASGAARVDFMVTHRFALEQVQEAFELVAGYRDGVVKAMIEM